MEACKRASNVDKSLLDDKSLTLYIIYIKNHKKALTGNFIHNLPKHIWKKVCIFH